MSSTRRWATGALVALVAALGLALAPSSPVGAAPNVSGYVLTPGNALLPLTLGATPSIGATAIGISGIDGELVGIDHRPADGELYGVALSTSAGQLRMYRLTSAKALVAPVLVGVPAATTVTQTDGWGVDVNNAADLVRVTHSSGLNLRANPTGANIGTTASMWATDGAITPGVSAAAYTNAFGAGGADSAGARATTFYGLAAGQLVAVDPPNSGAVVPVGADALITADAEFDITTNGAAYVVVPVSGTEQLRTISLANGAVGTSAIASAPTGTAVRGLAIETGPSPVVPGDDGYVVTEAGQLASFELATGAATVVAPVTGFAPGFLVEGIDTRPATGELYVLAVDGATNSAQLATLDRSTAVATPVGDPFGIGEATEYGFDFNPVVDRIRLVTDTGLNLRLHPAPASPNAVLANTDGSVNGLTATLTSTAYTNSGGPAAGTLHLAVDVAGDRLVVFTNSNTGAVRAGPALAAVDGDTGLDVAADGRVLLLRSGETSTVTVTNPITGAAVGSAVPIVAGTSGIGPVRAFAVGRNHVPRPTVTITADDQARPFGADDPTFTATVTGLPAGDQLATAPTCTTTAGPDSPVGQYPITCSGAADVRYQFAYVDGTLTVAQAATTLEVRAPIRVGGGSASVQFGQVSARLTSETGDTVGGQAITFRARSTVLCSAVTNADGVARCTTSRTGSLRILASNGYSASFAGTASYAPSTGTTRLVQIGRPPVVTPPTPAPPPALDLLERLLALLARFRR